MSDLSHYEQLGVEEGASFEAIQEARNQLLQEHAGDRRRIEAIESAYDSILMDRLRLRQEGKIKVPDRIRFPERAAEPPPDFVPKPAVTSPNWLQRMMDTPSRNDILLPGGLLLAAAFISLASPAGALALGTGLCFYFLNRKENKFARAFLLTLLGLTVGITAGLWIAGFLSVQLLGLGITQDTFAAIVTFVLLWLISSFLR
jgi:hypothetical protein